MKRVLVGSLCTFCTLTASVAAAEYTEAQQAMQYLLVAEGFISSPDDINEKMAQIMDKDRHWHDIKRLLAAGADPNGIHDNEDTQKPAGTQYYLYKCVKANEDVRLMNMLITAGAKVNIPLPDNVTLLHHIAVSFTKFRQMNPALWKDFLNVLINKGININQQTSAGITALMIAVKNGDLDLVEYLVDKGADTSLRHSKGMKAIDLVPNEHQHGATIREILHTAEHPA